MIARTPVVSVLMTAYNREAYIRDAIDSVLRSTLKDLELIVVDDSSTDNTVAIAREYQLADPRVSVYQNPMNIGDYPNRNAAASRARGEYLKYLDSDDLIYPHGLQVMVDCMRAFPDAGFGLCQNADRHTPYPRLLQPADSYREHYLEADLFGRAPGSAIIRRSAFEAVGGFPATAYVGDQALWLRLGSRFSLVKMPRDLYWTRLHPEQQGVYEPAETLTLRRSITLDALAAPECPLTDDERGSAMQRIRDGDARIFWSLVARRQKGVRPSTYKRCVGLPTTEIARFALSRVLLAAKLTRSQC